MDTMEEIRRDRTSEEVEGYLQLLASVTGFCTPSKHAVERLLDRAIALLDRLDAQYEADSESLYLRGQVYRAYERYEEAITCLNLVRLELQNDLHVWLALAWCYKRVHQIDLAIDSLEEALLVDSTQAIVPYNLACYYSLAGDVEKGVAYLQVALELDAQFRKLVEDESDFDLIRSHPSFTSLVSLVA